MCKTHDIDYKWASSISNYACEVNNTWALLLPFYIMLCHKIKTSCYYDLPLFRVFEIHPHNVADANPTASLSRSPNSTPQLTDTIREKRVATHFRPLRNPGFGRSGAASLPENMGATRSAEVSKGDVTEIRWRDICECPP